jgi:hypothetical protein
MHLTPVLRSNCVLGVLKSVCIAKEVVVYCSVQGHAFEAPKDLVNQFFKLVLLPCVQLP